MKNQLHLLRLIILAAVPLFAQAQEEGDTIVINEVGFFEQLDTSRMPTGFLKDTAPTRVPSRGLMNTGNPVQNPFMLKRNFSIV